MYNKLIQLPDEMEDELRDLSEQRNQPINYIVFLAIKKYLQSTVNFKGKKIIKKITICESCGGKRSRNSARFCQKCSNNHKRKDVL